MEGKKVLLSYVYLTALITGYWTDFKNKTCDQPAVYLISFQHEQ